MRRLVIQLLVVVALIVGTGAAWYFLVPREEERQPVGGPGAGFPPPPVVVAEAYTGTIMERVEAVGSARAREAVEVVAEVSGRVSAIHFEEGQRVVRGEVLIQLDNIREQAELREAVAQREDVGKRLARARQLLRAQHIPEAEVDELEAALAAAEARVAVMQTRLRDRQIRAPFDGIVGLREVSPGAYVTPGQRITTLDDLSVIRIEFSVPERFLGQLHTGLRVIARSPAFRTTEFAGTLSRIDTRVDPATRTVRVQAEFPNPEGRLRPGMFLGVTLILREWEGVLVAEEAVVSEGDRHFLFIVDADHDMAHRQEVTLGLRREGEVEIRSGVEAGARIVVEGVQRVIDKAPVRVLNAAAPLDGANAQAKSPGP